MIPENWKYIIISQIFVENEYDKKKNYLYFDENGILRIIPHSETAIVDSSPGNYGGKIFLGKKKTLEKDFKELFNDFNFQTISTIISTYLSEEGKVNFTTYDDLLHFSDKWREKQAIKARFEKKDENYRGLDRFITKVGLPKFESESKSKVNSSFDSIKIELFTVHEWPNKNEYVKENFKDIKGMALRKIDDSAWFKKYNGNLKSLKISSAKLLKQDIIEIVFKKVS